MASTIVVPDPAVIHAYSAEVGAAKLALGDAGPALALALETLASAAKTDIEALQAGTSVVGVNGTSVPATPTKGGVLQATSTTTAAWTVLYAIVPVLAIAVANQATLTGLSQTIDGVVLDTAGMRVYLAKQTTPAQNGIWVVASGAWTRPADWATGNTPPLGTVIRVAPGGTANWAAFGGEWQVTAATGVIDTGTITAYPRVCKGQQALTTGTPAVATVSSLWVYSATTSSCSLVEVTDQTKATLKGVLSAGAGTGSLAITGADTNTDTISYCVTNW